jgi:putative transposase
MSKVDHLVKSHGNFLTSSKEYWERHFWGRGYFSSTDGNATAEIINHYINRHSDGQHSENVNNISLD